MATPAAADQKLADLQTPISTPLPSPATFDILPPLHQLLSRLLVQSSAITAQDGVAATTAAANLAGDSNIHTYSDQQPLEIQQLAAEAGTIKSRIQRARTEVRKLPDMHRTIEDQQEEIDYLEHRCQLFREALAGLTTKENVVRQALEDPIATTEGDITMT